MLYAPAPSVVKYAEDGEQECIDRDQMTQVDITCGKLVIMVLCPKSKKVNL